MTIHVNFKEMGARVENIDELQKIALTMRDVKVERITVFFEFGQPEELLLFCRAIKLMPELKEIEHLEERKLEMTKQLQELTDEYESLKTKKEKRERGKKRKKNEVEKPTPQTPTPEQSPTTYVEGARYMGEMH